MEEPWKQVASWKYALKMYNNDVKLLSFVDSTSKVLAEVLSEDWAY